MTLNLPAVDPIGEVPDMASLEDCAGTVRASWHVGIGPCKNVARPLAAQTQKSDLHRGQPLNY
jgi:hypothetical protein